MMDTDKIKEMALIAVQDISITSISKQLLRSIYEYLDIEDSKSPPKSAIAQKISYIYELSRGQYDIYLNHPKSKQIHPQAKQLVWKIFKNMEQRINQRKFMQPKPVMREHMQHMMPMNQNMNMNMVNMFMDVPNLQTVQEIEIFQRKMFEIYKNFMPQVLSTMPASNQGNYYRNQNYQQSFMGGMGGLGNMQGMAGMQSMAGGLQGIQGMQNMQNMAGMTGMAGMGMGMGGMNVNNNRNGMGMMPNMGYQKFNDFYDTSTPYMNRYQAQNKINNLFQPQHQSRQPNEKAKMDFNRSAPSSQGNLPNTGFSFYGQRNQNDEFRGAFKNPYQQNKIISSSQELERKPVYSQKFINNNEESRESIFMQPNLYDFSPNLEIQHSKEFQKERQPQISSTPELPLGHQPRKMVKKDPFSASINQQVQRSQKSPKADVEDNEKDNFLFYNRIVEMDSFNEVQEVLLLKYITQDKTQISSPIPLKIMKKLYQNPDKFDIEIRCIKLDKGSESQIEWPERYRLSVDEQVVEEFSNLQSSLKKRKQKSFLFVKHFGLEKSAEEISNILMEIRNPQKGPNFLLGIFLVVKHTIEQVLEKFMKNIDEDNISEYFKPSAEKKQPLAQISICPVSTTSGKLIKEPVRGNNCSHPQCFDFEEFLTHLHMSQIRQWKCPLCSKQAKKFVIDNQMKNVLVDIPKMVEQPKQIIFFPNGGHYLKFNESLAAQSDKKQDCHESQPVQVKPQSFEKCEGDDDKGRN